MSKQAKVIFLPSGRRGQFDTGTPLLSAAQSLGVDIDTVCGGRGICRRCQISCVEGQFEKHQVTSGSEHLSPINEVESSGRGRRALAPGRRLSCQARIEGDLIIDVPPESQVHRQVVRKEAEARNIELDSRTRLCYVEVEPATLENDTVGDVNRLTQAIEAQWALSGVNWDFAVLITLQETLRSADWKVTVAIYGEDRIVQIWPGYQEKLLGIAIDLGSTTIAAHLCDLTSGEVLMTSSTMNPQIRFGEDLMSRVSYVMMHPEGSGEMTAAVRKGIQQLIRDVTEQVGASAGDVAELVVVGNPIMHHLFLGLSPVELGSAPFALAVDQALDLPARELELDIAAGGMVHLLPCIAGHVGADCAGVILAEEPFDRTDISLVVDVGTNAEIVLGNKDRLLACSSPTGPAFEGAQISCGQRAAPGAIERVRINPETLLPRFKVIGNDYWSDDSDFGECISQTGVTGICGSGIIEAVAEMYLAGIITSEGVIDGRLTDRCAGLTQDGRTWSYTLYQGASTIVVTQNDVREIQLAKAALYAGIKLLMEKMALEHVDRIRLAGAFGSHIDVKHAMVLGLIPDCPLDCVSSAGNAAGTGARIALLNQTARQTIAGVVQRIEKIETAVEPNFQRHFVAAMKIPHEVDPFNALFSEVPRPAPSAPDQAAPRGRRRRRRAKT